MIALTTLIYIGIILMFYKMLKVNPNPKNIGFFVVVGVVLIGGILIVWKFASPIANNLVVGRYTIQLVPQVKGPVTKIHAQPNVPLKKGEDILYEIQRDVYQFAFDQASASLQAAEANIPQLEAAIRAATAGVVSVNAGLAAAKAELDVAKETEKLNPNAIAKIKVVQLTEQYKSSVAAVDQAVAVEDQAEAALESARKNLVSLNAQLANAQFNLDQCTVYAPADGFVTQWVVTEGTMAVSMPFAPVGTFIDTSRTMLIASLKQNTLKHVKPGQLVEISLQARPGEVFTGSVESIVEATGEGQLMTSGQLVSAADVGSEGMFFVKFTIDDQEVANSLGIGTAGSVAIYTDRGKPFHVISKVTVRINAWMYYLNPF